MGGNLIKQVTNCDFEVKNFFGYDQKDGSFLYSSNEGSPMRESIYKTDKNGKKTKLSKDEGINKATFSPSMKYYVNTSTNLNTPTITTLDRNTTRLNSSHIQKSLMPYSA